MKWMGVGVFVFFIFNASVLGVVIQIPVDEPHIQAGIETAAEGDTVLVSDGIYTGTGNVDIDFLGKGITVTSENGPLYCIIDINGSESDPHRGFIFQSDEGNDSVLEGFTIQTGYSGGDMTVKHGAAIFCDWVSPQISNCIFTLNHSEERGGGLYIYRGGPTITGCRFFNNSSDSSGGVIYGFATSARIEDCMFSGNSTFYSGGTIFMAGGSTVVDGCSFIDNSAEYYAGAIWNNSSLMITNSIFRGNNARYGGGVYEMNYGKITNCVFSHHLEGGAIWCSSAHPTIRNCLITGNKSNVGGGGIQISDSDPLIESCTFTNNSGVQNGGAIYCYSGCGNLFRGSTEVDHSPAEAKSSIRDNTRYVPTIVNCIMWNDSPGEIDATGCDPSVTFSIVEGGWSGEGNLDEDPLFVSGPRGDYYLSQLSSGEPLDSPGKDAGSDDVGAICYETSGAPICMDSKTTRSDQLTDTDIVDIGYHYTIVECMHTGDIDYTGY